MNSEAVLDIFKKITAVPRGSGHEEKMTAWLLAWAKEHGYESKADKVGNVLVTREADKGKENVPTIVLQGHMDMVCDKLSTSDHDFLKDPIRYEIRDGWMTAVETTLGADDGIGIAAALALLEDKTPKGKIECLFTISEETDMAGAESLEEGFFSGKTLINLDSEDEGQLFIGCAGGMNTHIRFNFDTVPVREGYEYLRLEIGGGIGGHSGDDINKGRMNALQQLSRFLYSEYAEGLQLCSMEAGRLPNAIARSGVALAAVPDAAATIGRFEQFGKDLKSEFHVTDPDIVLTAVRDGGNAAPAIDDTTAGRLLPALFACPHGVEAMSQDIPGLVQTSSNLASIKMTSSNSLLIVTSQRSSARNELHAMAAKVAAIFKLAGAEVEHLLEYPGWNPDTNSRILGICTEAYRRLFGQEAEVKAIHAGLECGMFLNKFGNLDMISFGPTLRGVHAPGERLDLASMDRFVKLLSDVVVNFK